MDRMEHVKRPVLDGVRLQVLGGCMPPVDGGAICISAFFLIFSTRKQTNDEITVSLATPLSGKCTYKALLFPTGVAYFHQQH